MLSCPFESASDRPLHAMAAGRLQIALEAARVALPGTHDSDAIVQAVMFAASAASSTALLEQFPGAGGAPMINLELDAVAGTMTVSISGKAVQVSSMKSMLKASGTKRLKLICG